MILGSVLTFLVMAVIVCGYLIAASFIVWMSIDAGKQDKFWWMVIIFGLPVIGATVYYFTEKKHDYAKMPKESCDHCNTHSHSSQK